MKIHRLVLVYVTALFASVTQAQQVEGEVELRAVNWQINQSGLDLPISLALDIPLSGISERRFRSNLDVFSDSSVLSMRASAQVESHTVSACPFWLCIPGNGDAVSNFVGSFALDTARAFTLNGIVDTHSDAPWLLQGAAVFRLVGPANQVLYEYSGQQEFHETGRLAAGAYQLYLLATQGVIDPFQDGYVGSSIVDARFELAAVPIPAAAWLFLSGLAMLRRRKFN